jgi:antitoxin Phd
MTTWQVHSAKARFSELLERATHEGPQIIARRGTERAVVLSIDEYRRLVEARPNLRDYLLGVPRWMTSRSSDRRTGVDWSVSYLLDTNVVSETRRRQPEPKVMRWFEASGADAHFVSALTVGEITNRITPSRWRDSWCSRT